LLLYKCHFANSGILITFYPVILSPAIDLRQDICVEFHFKSSIHMNTSTVGTMQIFASCTMGTRSFPGVKRPGRGADHPPPSSAEVKKE
jgi:hypothetical protein